MIDRRRPPLTAVSVAARGFRQEQEPASSAELRSTLFSGDPELAMVAAGRLRLGRPGDPQYPAPIRSRGRAVAKVQDALDSLGYPLPRFGVDGLFGNETYRAVYTYKHEHDIRTSSGYLDGIVGPKTIVHLDGQLAQVRPPEPCRVRSAASIPDTTVRLGGVDFRFALGALQFNPTTRGEVEIAGNRVIVNMHRLDAANRCVVNAWAYTADVASPAGLRFGFVQNLLVGQGVGAYANGRVIRLEVNTPHLDAFPGAHVPFFAPFAVRTSGSGAQACLQDSPHKAFPLHLRGANITAICVHDRYRVFLVVEVGAGPRARYVPLVMKEIEICRGFRPVDPANPAGDWLRFGRQVETRSQVASPSSPLPAPLVSGPLANAATTCTEAAGTCNPTACEPRDDLCAIGCCPAVVHGPCCTPP
jgi:hypothetical protein